MFKLAPNSSFWAKVSLSVPGSEKPVQIELEFKYQSKTALKKYFESLESKSDAEAIGEIVLNWKGVDAEFSRENLEVLLENYSASVREIFAAYQREILEAKTKN